MNVRQFLAGFRHQGPRNTIRRRSRRIEHLENRCLLASVLWDGGAGTSNWHDAANWSSDVLPGPNDDVMIEAHSPGASAITFSSFGSVTIASLHSEKPLSLNSGTLSLSTESTINSNLTVAGGILTGDGHLTVTGNLTWTGGIMRGTGTTFVDGTLLITNGPAGSSNSKYLNRTLENRGQATLNGDRFYLGPVDATGGDGILRNLSSATLTIAAGAFVGNGHSGGNYLIDNQGLIVREGTGFVRIDTAFSNTGTLRVASGELHLNPQIGYGQSFTNAGTIDVVSGRLLLQGPGPGSLNSGTAVTGSGLFEVNSSLTLNTDVSIPRLQLGDFNQFAGPGAITGAGNLTVTDQLQWYRGTMSGTGTTFVTGTMNILSRDANVGGTDRYLQRTLENSGTANFTNVLILGQPNASVNALLHNRRDGVINLQTGAIQITGTGAAADLRVVNEGLIVRPMTGLGTFNVHAALHNMDTGRIRVESAVPLQLASSTVNPAPFLNHGSVELTVGGLQLSTPGTFEDGTSFSGSGILSVHSTLTVAADASVPRLDLGGPGQSSAGGIITGPAELKVTEEFRWYGGTMSGSGSTIAAQSMLIADGAQSSNINHDKYLRRTLANHGAANFASQRFYVGNAGTLVNAAGATLTRETGTIIGVNGSGTMLFRNQGRLISRGTGTLRIDIPVENTGAMRIESGTVNLQSGFATGGGNLANGGLIEIDGGSLLFNQLDNQVGGRVNVIQGTLDIAQSLALPEFSGILSSPNGRIHVAGSLLGSTTSEVLFQPNGTLLLDGGGSSASPRWLEVMGRDMGPVTDGFDGNFSYGTVQLQSTYVRLQDQQDNVSGAGPEALYIDTLVVNSGATLDLNGLPLYVRQASIQGTLIGSLRLVGDGGPLIRNSNNPGAIGTIGEIDEWTFFGRSGAAVTLFAEPGSAGAFGVTTPYLGGVRIRVIAPDGTEVIDRESAVPGERIALTGLELTQTGTYRVRITANGLSVPGTGNYGLSLFDATVDEDRLVFNERRIGLLESPYSMDRWTFVASANDQIRLDLLASAVRGLQFDLRGPQGWTGFTGLTSDSELLTLPSTGTYTLEARSLGNGSGGFSFEVQKTAVTQITPGIPYNDWQAGSGGVRLYRFAVAHSGPVSVDLQDMLSSNRNELYVGFGSPPDRRSYDFRSIMDSSSQKITIPWATAGEWYVLVYGRQAATDSPFTLTASTQVAQLESVSPAFALPNRSTFLTIRGVGFLPGTTAELVDAVGNRLSAVEVSINSASRITAEFDLRGLAPGDYSVRVVFADGTTDILADAFHITAPGVPRLETNLIAPALIGRFSTATFYVEYANTGTVPMPAPLLTLEPAEPNGDFHPRLTLDKSLQTTRFWSQDLGNGIETSVRIYAQGTSPGILQPGERIRVPVYYLGLAGPGNARTVVTSSTEMLLRVREAGDTEAIDWLTYIADSRPETIAPDAWNAVAANLTTALGNTWDEYLSALSANAAYLAGLGRSVSDMDELFEFVYRQADGIGVVPILASAVDASVSAPGMSLSYGRTFGNSVTDRYRQGSFGRGWQASAIASLQFPGNGRVTVVEDNGSVRRFEPDRRYTNRFIAGPGENGVLLTLTNGQYRLTEADGMARLFAADGKLQSVEDHSGNRVTYVYSGDNLTALQHSSGASVSIVYNAAGLIEQISDSTGWSTSYTYDPANTLLLSATTPAGTTRYTYVTGRGAGSQYALASIEDATGVVRSFEYDSQGRLIASYIDSNESRVEYNYDQPGRVVITDATATVTKLSFDHDGRLARREDGTGNYQLFEYDAAGNLIRSTDAFGATQEMLWTRSRQLLSMQDQLRGELRFAPGGPSNQPLSFTDSRGNTIRYQYDPHGHLLGRIFPDGTVERFEYLCKGPAGNYFSGS